MNIESDRLIENLNVLKAISQLAICSYYSLQYFLNNIFIHLLFEEL